MKYIMLKDKSGRNIPVIFPDCLVHKEFSEFVQLYLSAVQYTPAEVVSAGFVEVTAVCRGGSETLKLQSAPNDDILITFNDSVGSMDLNLLPPAILKELRDRLNAMLGGE